MSPEWLRRLDRARGQTPRGTFVKQALEPLFPADGTSGLLARVREDLAREGVRDPTVAPKRNRPAHWGKDREEGERLSAT